MPTSRPYAIEHICNWIIENKPHRILDIGFGHGKWGFLAREYTDVWYGRMLNYNGIRTIIDGIDIYSKYNTPITREIYNTIYIGDVLAILPNLNAYDLIICCDMLEHLNKKQGERLLKWIRVKAFDAFITTPQKQSNQQAVYGNEHEKHLCGWNEIELSRFGAVKKLGNLFLLEIHST
jgi:hypothetical protein